MCEREIRGRIVRKSGRVAHPIVEAGDEEQLFLLFSVVWPGAGCARRPRHICFFANSNSLRSFQFRFIGYFIGETWLFRLDYFRRKFGWLVRVLPLARVRRIVMDVTIRIVLGLRHVNHVLLKRRALESAGPGGLQMTTRLLLDCSRIFCRRKRISLPIDR